MAVTVGSTIFGTAVGNENPISDWSGTLTAAPGDWVVLVSMDGNENTFDDNIISWNGINHSVAVYPGDPTVSVDVGIFAILVGAGQGGTVAPVYNPVTEQEASRVVAFVVSGAATTLGDSGALRGTDHGNSAQGVVLNGASDSVFIFAASKDDPLQGGSPNDPTIANASATIHDSIKGSGVGGVTCDIVSQTSVTTTNVTFTWPAATARNFAVVGLEFPIAAGGGGPGNEVVKSHVLAYSTLYSGM